MHTTSLFLLALPFLSSALPTTHLKSKRVCSPTPPTAFTINGFSTFTPTSPNTTPASLTFQVSDTSDIVPVTRCTTTGTFIEPGVVKPCASPDYSFIYDGSNLTILETYQPCNSTTNTTISGTLGIATFCIPSEPPEPNGLGTQCLTPTGELTGTFTS